MKKFYMALSCLLTGLAANSQVLPNASFESWRSNVAGVTRTVAIAAPTSWKGVDSLLISNGQFYGRLLMIPDTVWKAQVYQDTANHHTGSSCAKLVTKDQDTLGVFPGMITNANPNFSLSSSLVPTVYYTGGTSVTVRPTSVSAWVKYVPAGTTDSGFITVQGISRVAGRDSVIGSGYLTIGGTDTAFRQVTATVNYASSSPLAVDTIRITIGSSVFGARGSVVGTILYVDDVTFTGVPTSITENISNPAGINAFPNPAGDLFAFTSTQSETYKGTMLTADGKSVLEFNLTGKAVVDVRKLPNGIYYYQFTDANGKRVHNGTVTIAH